ncbi:hypothetical protein FOXYSP1_09968 [Fusarium oxysporum f. sp. phaseoli]
MCLVLYLNASRVSSLLSWSLRTSCLLHKASALGAIRSSSPVTSSLVSYSLYVRL